MTRACWRSLLASPRMVPWAARLGAALLMRRLCGRERACVRVAQPFGPVCFASGFLQQGCALEQERSGRPLRGLAVLFLFCLCVCYSSPVCQLSDSLQVFPQPPEASPGFKEISAQQADHLRVDFPPAACPCRSVFCRKAVARSRAILASLNPCACILCFTLAPCSGVVWPS